MKNKKRSLKKKLFGRSFNIWDIIVPILIIISGFWVWKTRNGISGFFDELATTIFSAFVIGWIISFALRRQRK